MLRNKITSLIASAAIFVSLAVMPQAYAAFDAPTPDNGAAAGISNGGEWTIYASRAGQIAGTGAVQDVSDTNGVVEVTSTVRRAVLEFDLSTKNNNGAAADKVIKSAKLRLTPVVNKIGAKTHSVSVINAFDNIENAKLSTQFTAKRNGNDDFIKTAVKDITEVTEYPAALSSWQSDADITGDVICAGNTLPLLLTYVNGNDQKTEYATSNIAKNGRLNGGAVPFLYNDGATDYSKWVYPQIIFEYTDSALYKDAYADFVSVNDELAGKTVTETNAVSAAVPQNGSSVTFEMYGETVSPIKVSDNKIVFNDSYVGNDTSGNVMLTVTKTDGTETASYSRVIEVSADYTRSNTITFDTARNPLGVISVTSGEKTYTDGTAYAKASGTFTVDGGANIGYTPNITVKDEEENVIAANDDGSYTMPDSNVTVSVEYTKKTFGTTRTAAINSISLKKDGGTQGNETDIIIAADRITFLKFDLSGYDKKTITDATLSFTRNKGNSNTKAVFFIPNNDWDEETFTKDFCIDGTEDTKMSAFKTEDQTTVSVYGDDNRKTLIVPGSNGGADEDLSAAANGILGAYYLTSSGTSKSDTVDVGRAVKTALQKSEDGIITLMVYSVGGTGGDYKSVTNAETLSQRPSLTITESAAALDDKDLITEINTAEDFVHFSELVNGGNPYMGKTVTLNADIDLSDTAWMPIGSQDIGGLNPFAGTFDGGSHSVNLSIDEKDASMLGLFGIVTGDINNLTVTGNISGSSVIGGIVGWCSGNITNCSNRANIRAQREAGGITGTLSAGGSITNSDNAGNVIIEQKETYAGGIAGHNVDAVIGECTNTGKIENGSDGFRNKLGGIVGYLDNGKIVDCENSGAVESKALIASYTADESQNYVGGIAGYSSFGTIKNSNNSAAVHNAVDYAGGIAGFLQNCNTVTLCNNSGNVSGKSYVGGIAGYTVSDVSYCRNDGAVTGTGNYTGGVIGYLSTANLHNCSYDEAKNAGLDIVGFNDAGTITKDAVIDKTRVEYKDGKAVASAAAPGEYTLIFAAYDVDWVLKNAEVMNVSFDKAEVKEFAPSKTDFTNGAAFVKVMLWDGLDTMHPVCGADTK